ncbi:MAG: LytTR family transcriptional regulator DNA-binding domain-containing protein [Bacteroidota bacterium]
MNPKPEPSPKKKKSRAQQKREVIAWLHENFPNRNNISFMKVDDHFIKVYNKQGEYLIIWTSLCMMLSVLDHKIFYMAYRSYIINIYDVKDHCADSSGGLFIMSKDAKIPLTTKRYNKLKKLIPVSPTATVSI